MPLRLRSRCSICVIHCCPSCEASLTVSSSELKPGRITPPSAVLRGGSSTMALSINVMISPLSVSCCMICASAGMLCSASSGKQALTSIAARSPVARATISRGVAIRWRTRLIRRSISPAFFNTSASLACMSVSLSISPITCWRCWRIAISSKG